jgi:TorA maturation chaperone TorD
MDLTDEQKTDLRRILGDLYYREMDAEQLQRVLLSVVEMLVGMEGHEAAALNDAEDEARRSGRSRL